LTSHPSVAKPASPGAPVFHPSLAKPASPGDPVFHPSLAKPASPGDPVLAATLVLIYRASAGPSTCAPGKRYATAASSILARARGRTWNAHSKRRTKNTKTTRFLIPEPAGTS